jgi:hypothetical protein
MTPDDFREIALSFAGAAESSHMAHPDFRAHGKIFATLGYPNAEWGMVKLGLPDQKHFVESHPGDFVPSKGAWGLQGSTGVHLATASPDAVSEALHLAWKNSAATPARKASRKGK